MVPWTTKFPKAWKKVRSYLKTVALLYRIYYDMKVFGNDLDKKARMEKIMDSIMKKQMSQEEGKELKLPWHLIHPNCMFK